jgi:hypothetical protein
VTTLVDAPASPAVERPTSAPARWRGCLLFGLLALLYFTVGAVLMLRYNIFEGDGVSRVANASFALISRDPHLSAIGFVWNPLPGLIAIPLLGLSEWWPELRTHGLAGALQSALFTAGSALMIRRIALDRGVGDLWRRAAVACFALNPVIIVYGGSGMSEAGMLFCLLWCARYLLRWITSDHVGDLAWAGIALGVGYLVRYEMIPATAGAVGLVIVMTMRRSQGRARIDSAVLSALIVTFPIAAAFILWALAGWVVDGELFAQLSSQYGNATQVDLARAQGYVAQRTHWWTIDQRLLAMQPFVGIAALVAVAHSALSRTADALVPLATFGAVLAFSVWGEYSGTTFGFVRYYVAAIPMVIVIALILWRPAAAPSRVGAALVCASLFIAIPVTAVSMLNPVIGNHQLLLGISSLFGRSSTATQDQWHRRMSVDERLMADYFDRKNLPEGSVLTDTFTTWGLFQASEHPRQFVVTSDYDFGSKLNRPWERGVRYIVATNSGNAALDAINQRYPTMWDDGAGIGELVYSGEGAFGQEQYRIYRVLKPTDDERPPR